MASPRKHAASVALAPQFKYETRCLLYPAFRKVGETVGRRGGESGGPKDDDDVDDEKKEKEVAVAVAATATTAKK